MARKPIKQEEVIKWLQENASHIQLVEWGGSSTLTKSKFIDTNRSIEFFYTFKSVKDVIKKDKTYIFNPTKEEINKKKKETYLKNFGVEHVSKSKIIKEKKKETYLKNFGVEHYFITEEFKDQTKKTNLKKYGVEHCKQNIDIQEKFRQTCLKKYGVDNPNKTKKVRDKIKQTNIENYGVENPLQLKETQEKIKKTNLKKYGVEHVSKSENIKEKKKQTCLKNYGVENPLQNEKIKNKIKKTRIKKGLTNFYNGKTTKEWSKDPTLPSKTTINIAIREGIDPRKLKNRRSYLEVILEFYLENQLNLVKDKDFFCNKLLPEHEDLKKDEGRRFPDFLFPKYNLIIECDGERWHPKHLKYKDKERNKTYIDLGYNLLVFSGNQIKNKFDYLERQILKKIKK